MATTHDIVSQMKESLTEGFVPSRVFNDEDIYELEKDRIFGNTWTFLAHESEVPDPGDYVVRYICDDSYIIVRDEQDEINVLANACRHQGMQVCRSERGNTSHFRCPYHGWTYRNDGELIGVPFEHKVYGDDGIDHDESKLHSAPRLDTYNGLIFVCLNDEAEPLKEFLGDFKWYLDFFTGRGEEGMEVNGPQRRVIDSNWKIPIINSIGDKYHVATTHHSIGELDITGSEFDPDKVEEYQIAAGPGGLNISPRAVMETYPAELRKSVRAAFRDSQLELVETFDSYPSDGALFPNLTFLNLVASPEPDQAVPFTYIRTVRPLGPDKTEVYTWHVVEKDASEEFKEMAKKTFTFCFGASGTLTQDDIENWSRITEASNDTIVDELNFSMGMEQDPESDWKYPGTAYNTEYSESNARHYFKQYLDMLALQGGI